MPIFFQFLFCILYSMADLCICLGTSLQIQPINLVPFKAKKNKGKVVICNLQRTMCVSIFYII